MSAVTVASSTSPSCSTRRDNAPSLPPPSSSSPSPYSTRRDDAPHRHGRGLPRPHPRLTLASRSASVALFTRFPPVHARPSRPHPPCPSTQDDDDAWPGCPRLALDLSHHMRRRRRHNLALIASPPEPQTSTCDDNNNGALSSPSPRPHPPRYAPPPAPHPRVDPPHVTTTTAPRPHPPSHAPPPTPCPRVDPPYGTTTMAPRPRPRLALAHLVMQRRRRQWRLALASGSSSPALSAPPYATTTVTRPRLKSPHAMTTTRAPHPRPHLALTHLVTRRRQRLALVRSRSHSFVTLPLFFQPPLLFAYEDERERKQCVHTRLHT